LTEALCARNSCHNAYSAWASSNRARGTPGRRNPCSNCDAVALGASGAARDVNASVSYTPRCGITQPLDRTTSATDAGSGLARMTPSIGPS
jgi:hypothetical protein